MEQHPSGVDYFFDPRFVLTLRRLLDTSHGFGEQRFRRVAVNGEIVSQRCAELIRDRARDRSEAFQTKRFAQPASQVRAQELVH